MDDLECEPDQDLSASDEWFSVVAVNGARGEVALWKAFKPGTGPFVVEVADIDPVDWIATSARTAWSVGIRPNGPE